MTSYEVRHHGDEPLDEIDRLYARLPSVEPPPDFVAAVMARVGDPAAAATPAPIPAAARVAWSPSATVAWLALQLLGALLVGLAAYWLGHAFWTTGAYDLLALLREDADLFGEARDTYLTALLETLPWLQLGAVALALTGTALTWIYSRNIAALFSGGTLRNGSR